jgi:EAL domain-containing protein (putative c-di-GMP-specific phosphodiesterase class I)
VSAVFQPVLDLASGEIVGVEALARFTSRPRRGPDVWFSEAFRAGRGVALELLAVRRALAELPRVPDPVFLALNVSPATLLSPGLARLCGSDVCPRLVLELTEHVQVEDYDLLNAVAARFRRAGARIAVDDTGAGFAGFRHLLALGPDIVKLDLSLTHGIDSDPVRRALASALVRFTADTGTHLVAEGVETAAELATLRELGVPWAQGYHLARPAPIGDVSFDGHPLPEPAAVSAPR